MIAFHKDYYSSLSEYSPLAILILGLPFFIKFDIASPLVFLLIVLFFNLLNTFLFYKILEYLKINNLLKTIYTSFFCLYVFLLDGTLLILEPFVLFFALIGVIFIFREKYLMAGLMVFLSFYSKQYGLFSLPAFILLPFIISSKWGESVKKASKVLIGFLIPFIILLFYVNNFYNNIYDSLLRIMGIGSFGLNATGDGHHILRVFYNSYQLVISYPFLCFGIYLLFRHFRSSWNIFYEQNQEKLQHLFFIFLLLMGSLFQLFFASYFHYFILIIPWLMILTAILHSEFIKNRIDSIVFAVFIIISLFMSSLVVYDISIRKPKSYKDQISQTKYLNEIVPRGSKVQLQRKYIYPYQFFLAGYLSSNYQSLGYHWDNMQNPDYIISQMEEGSYYICKKELDLTDTQRIQFKKVYLINQADTIIVYKIGPELTK
jgi:hypothetical protein